MSEQPGAEVRGFERFVADRGRGLWRAAWLLTGDSHHAEDLVQTALSTCYSRYDDISGDESFEAYVRTAIYRTFVSWWRRMSWRNETPSDVVAESESEEVQSSLRIDIMRALDGLPRMQRAVMVLQYLEDRSVDDIAALLGVTSGTVKTHSHRGRAALRGSIHLEDQGATS
ncbi:SigE family RNA polymerase sigma factor [Tessaracoccus sp.]